MRKAEFAEAILQLTTTPERAASTAGDLTEESAQRGNLWFWTSLIRTTASLVWRAWADAPRRMMELAVKMCLIQFGIILAFTIPFGTVLGFLVVLGKVSADIFRSGIAMAISSIVVVASDFLIGLWLSRRARGRELAGWASYFIIMTLVWRVLIPSIAPQEPGVVPVILDPLVGVAEALAFFAGVKRERRAPPVQLISR